MTDTIDEKVEFFGKEFKIDQIANQHLKRLISEKNSAGYSDWSRYACHSDKAPRYREKYTQYGDWSRYADYNDYS